MKRVFWGVAAAAVIAAGAAAYFGLAAEAAPTSTFVLLDGSSKTTGDLKGRVTLVTSPVPVFELADVFARMCLRPRKQPAGRPVQVPTSVSTG